MHSHHSRTRILHLSATNCSCARRSCDWSMDQHLVHVSILNFFPRFVVSFDSSQLIATHHPTCLLQMFPRDTIRVSMH